MLSKIIRTSEKIGRLGKSQRDKQRLITTTEVASIWDILSARYDSVETTQVMLEFAKDTEFKLIIKRGHDYLLKEIDVLEKIINEYGIPSPERPPVNPVSILDTEVVTDKYIFRHTLNGIQSFFPILVVAFTRSVSAQMRSVFKKFLIDEVNIYDELLEYGIIKGWVNSPPAFRQ